MDDEFEALRTLPTASLKYIPTDRDRDSWVAPADSEIVRRDPKGLPIPPDRLLVGYADSAEVYLHSGAFHVRNMTEKLRESGFAIESAKRILDLGAGIGRMIRNLVDYNPAAEMWGVDISGPHIQWCKAHLTPPFHFATTTTIPHLPFPDGHFDLVYAGSVFTHIDDLADAWLLELRRVLSPEGRAYVTLHDEATIELLHTHPVHSHNFLADQLRASPSYQQNKDTFGMLVIGRGVGSQVYYRREYFTRMVEPLFAIRGVHPEAHGYQSAYIMSPVGAPRVSSWRESSSLGGPHLDLPERAFPGMPNAGFIAEHCVRYAFAQQHVAGLRVLDLGCGTGFGSEMLTWVARSVHGFDLWQPAPHEHPQWPGGARLTYGHDLCEEPLPPADAAVAFEVIEHLYDAPAALRLAFEAAPMLVLSFPNPRSHRSPSNKNPLNDWTLERLEHELREAAKHRYSSLELTHLHQIAAGPLIVPGRDPESSYWIVIARAGD